MKDVVDFRVGERFAVGHDPLNTIVFRIRERTVLFQAVDPLVPSPLAMPLSDGCAHSSTVPSIWRGATPATASCGTPSSSTRAS